jgi:DnaD/phage-associated family protein
LGAVVREYQQRLGSLLSSQTVTAIEASLDFGMSPEVLVMAADKAWDAGVPTGRYVSAILRDWRAKNVKTVADVSRVDRRHDAAKNVQVKPNAPRNPYREMLEAEEADRVAKRESEVIIVDD